MRETSHGASCLCVDCRGQRAKEHAAAVENSKRSRPAKMKKSAGLTQEERETIEHYPAESILLMREGGYTTQDIRECLVLIFPEATEESLGELFDSADEAYTKMRRTRGVTRLAQGVGAIAVGLLVAVPLVMFGGILAFITVLAVIWGVVQIVQGVGDLNAAKTLRAERRPLLRTTEETSKA